MSQSAIVNIFFVIDKNFIIPFTVALTSVLENNQNIQIEVFVIHDIEDVSILDDIITFFKTKYSVVLNLITLSQKRFDDIPNDYSGSKYISKATYFKLLFGEILPKTITCGLYLDCDTIVTGSLKDIPKLTFKSPENDSEYSILAVSDSKKDININRIHELDISLNDYFNAGVMFINLNMWRIEGASNGLIIILERFKNHLKWLDQDVLNIYFKDKVGKMDSTYNVITSMQLQEIPLIIHYSGESKPWHYVNNGPYKYLFYKYLKLTPFINFNLDKITLKKVKQKYSEKVKLILKLKSL